jgi:hypothetical protein
MVQFHALTTWPNPGLYIWRPAPENSRTFTYPELPPFQPETDGFKVVPIDLDHQVHEPVYFKLYGKENAQKSWEDDAFNRKLIRLDEYRFPTDVWFVHDVKS